MEVIKNVIFNRDERKIIIDFYSLIQAACLHSGKRCEDCMLANICSGCDEEFVDFITNVFSEKITEKGDIYD
nr:MAG TPA: hypothetical protein [Caudoviricetes sp.]